MPKNKIDSSSDSDSGPDDLYPPVSKKSKPDKPASSKSKADEEEPTWQIDKMRFLKIQEFRGKTYVDIREWYESNEQLKPGRKGICLTPAQWKKLNDVMEEVNDTLKQKC